MDSLLLIVHKYLMMVVLLDIFVIFFLSALGFFSKKVWSTPLEKITRVSVIFMDIQFTLGLLVYIFFSPIVKTGLSDFSSSMKIPEVRFFLVEHGSLMLIALGLAHVGKVKALKAGTDNQKYKFSMIFFGLVLVVLTVGIPWKRLIQSYI